MVLFHLLDLLLPVEVGLAISVSGAYQADQRSSISWTTLMYLLVIVLAVFSCWWEQ